MKNKNFFVYKYLNAQNEIIYIGQTTDIRTRVWDHNVQTDKIKNEEINKIYYYRCQHKTEMDAYEYFLIRKYHPKYNSIFIKEKFCDIEDPEWILYKPEDFQKSKFLRKKRPSKLILCVETGIIYNNARDIEKKLGIPHSNIYQVCAGKRQTAHNMHWRYIDENQNELFLSNS